MYASTGCVNHSTLSRVIIEASFKRVVTVPQWRDRGSFSYASRSVPLRQAKIIDLNRALRAGCHIEREGATNPRSQRAVTVATIGPGYPLSMKCSLQYDTQGHSFFD
jgi:hypothetical protein